MSKKILGSLGIVAGLGLAVFLGYHFLSKPDLPKLPAPSPPGTFQGVIGPTPEPTRKPDIPASSPAVVSEPAAPPVPPPGSPPAEKATAPLAPLEPREEPGLLAGKYRHFSDAKRLLAKIQKQQMPAFIRKEGNHYLVWAGPFATPQEAEQAKKALKTALRISPQSENLEVPVPK